MENQWRDFPQSFLIRLTNAASSTVNDVSDVPTLGEIILSRPPEPDEMPEDFPEIDPSRYDLMRFAIMMNSVALESGESGIISMNGVSGAINFALSENEDGLLAVQMEIPVNCFVAVEALEAGYHDPDEDFYEPYHLPFQGMLNIRFVRDGEAEGEEFIHINNWRIAEIGFNAERVFEFAEQDTLVHHLGGTWGGDVQLLSINTGDLYPPSNQTGLQRRIDVRPIWVYNTLPATADEIEAFESYIRTQMTETQEVWSRALIDVRIIWETNNTQIPFAFSAGTLAQGINPMTGNPYPLVRDWLKGIRVFAQGNPPLRAGQMGSVVPQAGTIDVYFTDWINSPIVNSSMVRIAKTGGGLTLGSNTAIASIITTSRRLPSRNDPNPAPPFAAPRRWMDYLVAHEFGHVLGMQHPDHDPNDLISDGELTYPVLTAKPFRWDPAGDPGPAINNCPMGTDPNDPLDVLRKARMCNILASLDAFWRTPSREPNYTRAAVANDILIDVVRKPIPATPPYPRLGTANFPQQVQTLLDTFADQLTTAEVGTASDCPIFVLFINDSGMNAITYAVGYSTGLAVPRPFPLTIYVFNKAIAGWQTRFTGAGMEAVAFQTAIYRLVKQPTLALSAFGTIMEPNTPDPSVLNLQICQTVSQGLRVGGKLEVSSNPAARYLTTSAAYRPDRFFGMYIPSKKGDVGRLTRPETGIVYHSPYVWNRLSELSTNPALDPTLQNVRTLFYEPNEDNPTHVFPSRTQTNHLYVHVRMRANHLPAIASLTAATYAGYFQTQTRLFVAGRYPGSGGTSSLQRLGASWSAGNPVELINNHNLNLPTPYDSAASIARQDAAHPFVAGLSYHHQWSVPAGMPAHSCIFAFVINEHEPLRDRFGNVLLSWAQANAASWDFGTWATALTADQFSYLVEENLQFIQRNVDVLPLPPNFFAKFSLPPMVFERGGFGDDFEPFYLITTENLQGNARLFIETFTGEEQELILENGRIEFNAADTALRAGIYGMAFSLQLEEGAVLAENIVIEYRTKFGEVLLDGYRFEIQNSDEGEFAHKAIETSLFALNAYIDLFGDEVVAQMRDTIEGFDSQDFADLLNWLHSHDAYTLFESLYADVQEKAPADMSIVAQLGSFIANLGSASDEQLLLDFKTVFDRLHLLLMLNNGIIAGSGISASQKKAQQPPPVESAATTEPQNWLQALLDFIRKLFS